MKEKLAQALEIEFHYTEVGFKNETDSNRKAEILWYARQRGLGAVNLAQLCGCPMRMQNRCSMNTAGD